MVAVKSPLSVNQMVSQETSSTLKQKLIFSMKSPLIPGPSSSEHTFQCLFVYHILTKHVFLIQLRLIIIWSLVIGRWARELTDLLE